MAMLTGNTTATGGDERFHYGEYSGAGATIADASFTGGYCYKDATMTGIVLAIPACGANSTALGSSSYGYKMWAGIEFKQQSYSGISGGVFPILAIDDKPVWNTVNFNATTGGKFIFAYVGESGGGPFFGVGVQTAGGAGYVLSGSLMAITLTQRYLVEIEVQQTDSTHLLVTLYVDGASQGSHSFATSVFDALVETRVAGGLLTNIAPGKGATCDMRWGPVYMTDNTGSIISTRPTSLGDGTGLHTLVRLPTGDVTGETNWTSHGGGAGSYTEWDDALGSLNVFDYNQSGANATKQGSTFPGTAVAATATVVGVGLHVVASDSATPELQLGLDDGTESLLTAFDGPSSNLFGMAFWGTSPSGAAWSVSELNALKGKGKRNGSTSGAIVSALWMTDWYYSAAAASGRARSRRIMQAVNRAASY